MICKKCLTTELENIPRYLSDAVEQGDFEEALSLFHCRRTLEWILGDDDCKRGKRNG